MQKRKRRKKHCGEIAKARARQSQHQKKHPIMIGWVFIAALLSIRSSILSPVKQYQADDDYDWPISDCERGFSTAPKLRRARYIEQPTIKRLMHDLRRPAARDDAMQVLLARIDDIGLRGWVIEQIREGHINRLAVHVRPGLQDVDVLKSWQAELEAENAEADEAMNEAVTQAELMRRLTGLVITNPSNKSRTRT
ncbi:hypothetical protein BG46_02260 [Brucella anthropi]|uniref:hypothetical protein n=1 Tax=Brucella anthropi TaxID=529 RepID=UPI00044D7B74|nr:hypothetical protein [Brucella anthropi]EXL08589.1 hypothetical protein BG46_02260 [Brucella anthropi]